MLFVGLDGAIQRRRETAVELGDGGDRQWIERGEEHAGLGRRPRRIDVVENAVRERAVMDEIVRDGEIEALSKSVRRLSGRVSSAPASTANTATTKAIRTHGLRTKARPPILKLFRLVMARLPFIAGRHDRPSSDPCLPVAGAGQVDPARGLAAAR